MPRKVYLTYPPSSDLKTCSLCKTVKPLSAFTFDRTSKTGRKSWCLDCYRDYQRKRRKDKPEQIKKEQASYRLRHPQKCIARARRNGLKRRYGITIEQYDSLLASQGGVCAICRRTETYPGRKYLSVDHCHETGVVRGLLCNHCNRAIGFLSENYQVAQRAVEYLRSSKEVLASA